MIRILFVCMGNICRSPAAEGLFRAKVDSAGLNHSIIIDSAGTHGYHEGEPPDARSIQAASKRGIDISGQRSRPVIPSDFLDYDLIIAMDNENVATLNAHCPKNERKKIRRLLDYATKTTVREVPDPYYGGVDGFDKMMDLLDDGLDGLLTDIRNQLERAAHRQR